MKAYLNRILDIPASDPDEARRGRLLNILLLGIISAALLGLAGILIDTLPREGTNPAELQITLVGIGIFITGAAGIYWINRRYSARLGALLFLLLLTGIFVFTDVPKELVVGRSLFLFTIPITISSLILAPRASFLFASLSSVIVTWLGLSVGIGINIFVISGFFILALVSWLFFVCFVFQS